MLQAFKPFTDEAEFIQNGTVLNELLRLELPGQRMSGPNAAASGLALVRSDEATAEAGHPSLPLVEITVRHAVHQSKVSRCRCS